VLKANGSMNSTGLVLTTHQCTAILILVEHTAGADSAEESYT
jgi:ABC-type uncharacterized transport system ATPase component